MRGCWRVGLVLLTGAMCCGLATGQGGPEMKLVFCCEPDNDVYNLVSVWGRTLLRFDSPADAIWLTPKGSGLAILASEYPYETVTLSEEMLDEAAKKGLRVYIEYPTALCGVHIGEPRQSTWERGVVTSDWFAPALERSALLAIHDCHFVPVDAAYPYLSAVRVAGYDRAAYALPEWISPRMPGCKMFPLLVKHPLGDVLIGTTKLSQFVTGRYGPTTAWRAIWERILAWLARDDVELADWTPTAAPSFGRDHPLPEQAESLALKRGAQWYFHARMLVHPDWHKKLEKAPGAEDGVTPAPMTSWPVGDGKLGVLEGVNSRIDYEGRQPVRYWLRNDCIGESGMALAFHGTVNDDGPAIEAATNLHDFIHFHSELAKGPRADPASASFGLLGWNTGAGLGVYYGDDNARSMLGTMATAALLKTNRWDERLLRCLLANLRTTGAKGFRGARLDEQPLQQKGWRHFFDADTVHYAPHYEAYLWACFLWAYDRTAFEPFLERTKAAIRMTMQTYPDQWRWTNGIQQERARMLLALAWLVRIEDTQEHRGWLRRIADDLIEDQDACGAIREELGPEGMGAYGPAKSNDEYGTNEATLIHQNGDPACDLLYTTNFAFLGLHEAAAATGEQAYREAEDKLAEFLCRIQVRSADHAEVDGGWFRAFDFERWEYWGSNADVGWGAWSIESGWTQGWITSVLALRQMNTSFWELTQDVAVKKHLAKLEPMMFAKGAPASDPAPEPPPEPAPEPSSESQPAVKDETEPAASAKPPENSVGS